MRSPLFLFNQSASVALVRWTMCSRCSWSLASAAALFVAMKAHSTSLHSACNLMSVWLPNSAIRCWSLSSSSAWVAIIPPVFAKIFSKSFCSWTSKSPVLLPMNILIPQTPSMPSISCKSLTLSLVAPAKNPKWFTVFDSARAILASKVARFVALGTLFGISKKAVTPPATAALLPLCKSSLSVLPGSLKWTCGSIAPGSRCNPVPSISNSPVETSNPPPVAIVLMEPLDTRRSPSTIRSDKTKEAFWIRTLPSMVGSDVAGMLASQYCSHLRIGIMASRSLQITEASAMG